tara:strand:- start:23455 stop:23919 length:465 start_codon:yes stop_codon:yes gene_type:complete
MKHLFLFLFTSIALYGTATFGPEFSKYSQNYDNKILEYENQLFESLNESFRGRGYKVSSIYESLDIGSDWRDSWLGIFYQSNTQWIYHIKLKWIYPHRTPTGGYWLWLESTGWIWTDESFYPFFCDEFSRKLYLYNSEQRTIFYCYDRDILINP